MVFAKSKDGTQRLLVYQNSLLAVDKDDSLTFSIENEHLNYKIRFSFSSEGEKYSTTYWESEETGYLHLQLNSWDSTTYVEISKPILLKVKGSDVKFWLKFRNQSIENKPHRKFEISIWKEVKNGN
jgi:hypothetical protein